MIPLFLISVLAVGRFSVHNEQYAYKTTPNEELASRKVSAGWNFMNPRSKNIDYDKAYRYNYEGYKLGNLEGAANIGMLYEYGWGVPINLSEAERWYSTARSSGSHRHSSQAEIGLLRLALVHKLRYLKPTEIEDLFEQAQSGSSWSGESSRLEFEREISELRTLYFAGKTDKPIIRKPDNSKTQLIEPIKEHKTKSGRKIPAKARRLG